MAPVVTPSKSKKSPAARVLVVEDEPQLAEVIADAMAAERVPCHLSFATDLSQARRLLASQSFDLLLTDLHLPDGDGMTLLPALRERRPDAGAIVITGDATVDNAVSAIRHGAADFVSKPFTGPQLADRVKLALRKTDAWAEQERKIQKLKAAVRKLNEARKLVTKKVDLLCNDLVSAYGELSKQLDNVRTQEGFRKYLEQAKDLEQLLCHAMDWLLRQMGYANVAVWLAAEDGQFQLGAYMKYTTPGDAALTDALKRVVLPKASDGVVRANGDELKDELSPTEYKYLQHQAIIGVGCTYLGEQLAAVVFFRDGGTPFTDDDAATLKAVSPIFAGTLASVVKDVDQPADDAGDDHASDDVSPDADGPTPPRQDRKAKPKKPDAADWWKRGEAPPF
ncbi:MAG TPA: response regulator [Tepidisphaeraceae bacterium]|nr:response regulator [Tepidisphaeraceae bacterium]